MPRHIHPKGEFFAPKDARVFVKLSVHETPSIGKGLFSEELVYKSQIIAVDGGLVLSSVEDVPKHMSYCVLIDKDTYLGPTDFNTPDMLSLINHSCHPNIKRIGGLVFSAKKTIQPGEQLTIDYAPLVAGVKDWQMECHCGAEKCRKIITGNDWKNKILASMLWEEWLPHIQSAIIRADS